MLTLERPLVFLDLETTGLDRENDRILQIAMTKYFPDFSYCAKVNKYLNPTIPIPQQSTDIHGITDEMVVNNSTFAEVANVFFDFLQGCDIAGFNSNWFDVPLLYNEFRRAGFHWIPGHLIDAGNLFKIEEPRNLENAVRFYCRRNMSGAHNAINDVSATVDVLLAQLGRYPEVPRTVPELALYTNYGCKRADVSGKLAYTPEGVLIYAFSKYKNQPVSDHLDFAEWMYRKADFPADTCEILADVLGYGYYLPEEESLDADASEIPF